MTKEFLMQILISDLDMICITNDRRILLDHLVESSKAYMRTAGINVADGTEEHPFTREDADLIRMYAGYLYRKRTIGEEMPRMLRLALNNRLFSQKARGEN